MSDKESAAAPEGVRNIAGPRYVYMDGLRGLAAVGVLLSHVFQHLAPALHHPDAKDSLGMLLLSSPLAAFCNGEFSVYIFFVLSGFVLSASVAHSRLSLLSTAVRRYVRLTLPIMGITLLFLLAAHGGLLFNRLVSDSAPLTAALYPPDYAPSVSEWISKCLYGIYWTGEYQLDGPVWTMRVEIWGSLLVYVVWRAVTAKAPRMLLCVCLFAVLALTLHKNTPLQGIQLFPVGILIYDLAHGTNLRLLGRQWSPFTGFPVLLLGILFGAWRLKEAVLPGIHNIDEMVFTPLFGGISRYESQQIGAILLVASFALTVQLHRPFSGVLFRFLGAISFPLYLFHLLAIASIGSLAFAVSEQQLGATAARWIAVPVTCLAAIGVATLLAQIIEKPSISIAKRLGDRCESILGSLRVTRQRRRAAA